MDSLQFRLNNVRNSSWLKFSNHNHTQGKPNDQILQVLIECYNHIFYSFDIHDILGCSRCHYAYLKQKVDGKDTVHVFIFSLFLNQKQESFHNFMLNISYNLPQDYELFFLGRMRIGIKLGIQFYSLSNNENLHVSLSSDYFLVSDLKP